MSDPETGKGGQRYVKLPREVTEGAVAEQACCTIRGGLILKNVWICTCSAIGMVMWLMMRNRCIKSVGDAIKSHAKTDEERVKIDEFLNRSRLQPPPRRGRSQKGAAITTICLDEVERVARHMLDLDQETAPPRKGNWLLWWEGQLREWE